MGRGGGGGGGYQFFLLALPAFLPSVFFFFFHFLPKIRGGEGGGSPGPSPRSATSMKSVKKGIDQNLAIFQSFQAIKAQTYSIAWETHWKHRGFA